MVAPSTVVSRLDGLEEPVKLAEWWPAHMPSEELSWKSGYGEQIRFVRNSLAPLLCKNAGSCIDEQIENSVWVISTHYSKSVMLPVFHLKHPTKGLELVMRCNFYDWKVSVISDHPIIDNFYDLFGKTNKIHDVYCEGFDPAWVYGPYAENSRQFTIELGNDHHLFTFFWLLMSGLER